MKTSNDPFGNKMLVNQEMVLFWNLFLSLFAGFFRTSKTVKLQSSSLSKGQSGISNKIYVSTKGIIDKLLLQRATVMFNCKAFL